MKTLQQTLFFVLILLIGLACSEVPTKISPIGDQLNCQVADYELVKNQPRQVLIEEFTGVQCRRCPGGSRVIDDLIGIHGEQMIAISIHANRFAIPIPASSAHDFRTDAGEFLFSFLEEPLGYPSGVVNRKLFNGQSSLQTGKEEWPGMVQEELNGVPKVKLFIQQNFDPISRELTAEVSIFVEETIEEEEVRISLSITEDDIVDWQFTETADVPDYVHKHVLRGMLTNFAGNPIDEKLTAGTQLCKSFIMTLPNDWIADNCHLIAFVHLEEADQRNVLQAESVGVTE